MVDILGSRPLLVSVSFIIMEDQVADDDSLERQAKKIAILEKNLSESEHFKLSTNRYEYYDILSFILVREHTAGPFYLSLSYNKQSQIYSVKMKWKQLANRHLY